MEQSENISQKPGSVLVIEDELFLVEAYRAKFDKEGISVRFITNGSDAIDEIGKEAPRVILLDLMLPGVNGFDILGAIKKNEQWKDVPVIVLSNLSQEKDIGRCAELGAKEFIVKANTKLSDIIQKVKQYL